MNVPIVEAQPLSSFFNPAKDAQNNLTQVMQMRGLQEREQHNQLLARAEQQKVDLQKRAGDATQAFMKNPGDPNAQLGIAQIMVETGKAEDVVKWMRHDTGLAAVAKSKGFQVNELQGMSDLPATQFTQLYGPELEKNLKVQASELADLHQDNAKFTGAFKAAVDADTYYEKNANEVLGADRAIINLLSGKKDLSASEKERLTTAQTSLAKNEAKITEQRKGMDEKSTQYASAVRDGALYQQDALARHPHADTRQQQLYSDVYALKANVADAYLAYKQESTPENKRTFQDASVRYDAKVKEIAIRATEYKTEAEQQAMANTQKTVQGMKSEEADREAQARFAKLPLDQQTSQNAEKIARAMLADGFAFPDITKMRGAARDPNKQIKVGIDFGQTATAGTAGHMQERLVANQGAMYMVGQLKQTIQNSNIGLVGAVKSNLAGIEGQIDGLGEALFADAQTNGSKLSRSLFFDPGVSKVETLGNMLAYALARSTNAATSLSDKDVINYKKQIGIDRILANKNDALTKLGVIEQYLKKESSYHQRALTDFKSFTNTKSGIDLTTAEGWLKSVGVPP